MKNMILARIMVSGDENNALQDMICTEKARTNGNRKGSYIVSKTQRSMGFFILRVFGEFSDVHKINV